MAEFTPPDKLPLLRRVVPLEFTPVKRVLTPEQIAAEEERKAKAAARIAAGEPPDPDPNDDDEADSDRFDMSFSSEAPVERWFGDEILDHSSSAIDMGRASRGMAYLVDHDTGDHVGLIENLRTEKNKLKGTVRFGRSQRAQDIKRDVQDGIRPFTSIGYRVNELVLEKEEKTGGDTHRTYRVTRWTPMEGSTVAVPADTSVGASRASGTEEFAIQFRSAIPSQQPGDTTTKEPIPGSTSEVRVMATTPVALTPKDSAEILRLCDVHKVDRTRAIELIEREGMTVDRASAEILADVAKRDGKAIRQPSAEHIELTAREQEQYSVCRGIMTLVRNFEENKRETSLETEISDQISKRWEGKDHGGLKVPWGVQIDPQGARRAAALLKRAGVATALATNVATQGGDLVFTEPGPFIQFLYNAMRLKELGVETMSGLQGNIAFPKQTGRATGSWVGENPGVDVADSNLTLGQVLMSPKTYQTSCSYSRQLLAQSVVDIDNLVRMDISRDAALAIDLAGISGLGVGSLQPLGILHTTGVQSYTLAADSGNGGDPTWADVVGMQEYLEAVNADQIGEFRWLTTPGIKGVFKRTPRLVYTPPGTTTTVNVSGDPIWAAGDEIDGLEARWSNQVPNTLVTGTSGAHCHALILGVFSSMITGLWGSGYELVVDPYRLKKMGLIELTSFILCDIAMRYPSGFVAATDCLTS